ncbi:MAG: flagellar basal body L-ring protein FlgH [Nitrospinota bacterium]
MADSKIIIVMIFITAPLLSYGCSTKVALPDRPIINIEAENKEYSYGSLWVDQNGKNSLFHDYKANKIGDLVTVVIVEATTAVNKSDTKSQRDFNSQIGFDSDDDAKNMGVDSRYKFNGAGATHRADKFEATISCIVKEILPNGNFVIEGQRRMQINDEEQYMLVKGIVHPKDISSNNKILSTKIANGDIRYTGGGAIAEGKRPGWLGQILRKVLP